VYVAYSTVIDCHAYLQLPSGYLYYVRIQAANAFGVSPAGDSNTIIAAGTVPSPLSSLSYPYTQFPLLLALHSNSTQLLLMLEAPQCLMLSSTGVMQLMMVVTCKSVGWLSIFHT
jgi:hypothetical protein